MHSSWSFTAGVALLSTCSAKALVPRGDDVPDNCSLVPQVFYPKVINTCCDKATTITVEECQTEIVLPTPGCIDTTITQTVTKTKTDDWHPRKSGTKTAAPASTSVPPASTSNPVVYKRDHSWGGNSGRWDNRRKPWDGLTVYNPVFEGKNIDSDGNGDYRDNKLHYEDNSYTRKTDNSREYDIDQSGDYRDNQLKYDGGEGNGDGSQYNTGDGSGNNRENTDESGDYRNNKFNYEDDSRHIKTDVDVDVDDSGNDRSGNYLPDNSNSGYNTDNSVDDSGNVEDSGNYEDESSRVDDHSKHEYDFTWSPVDDNSRQEYDYLSHNDVEDSGNDDHSREDNSEVDIDVRLQDFLKNNGDYRDNTLLWYEEHNTYNWYCNVNGDSNTPGFFSITLNLCIQLPIGLSLDLGDTVTTSAGLSIVITQDILDRVIAELQAAGLDQYGLPFLPSYGG